MLPHKAVDWVYLAGALLCLGGVLAELWLRKRAGPVLLDLGDQGRGIRFGAGVLMLVLGCFDLLFPPPGRFQGFFFIAWGATILLLPGRRFQICQSGIFARKLFRWEEIDQYYLSPTGGLALKLNGKDWTRPGARIGLDRWQQANALLASRLPAQRDVIFAP